MTTRTDLVVADHEMTMHRLHVHERLRQRGETPANTEYLEVAHGHDGETHTHPVVARNGVPVDDYHNRYGGLVRFREQGVSGAARSDEPQVGGAG